jgi:hypothetical protein
MVAAIRDHAKRDYSPGCGTSSAAGDRRRAITTGHGDIRHGRAAPTAAVGFAPLNRFDQFVLRSRGSRLSLSRIVNAVSGRFLIRRT